MPMCLIHKEEDMTFEAVAAGFWSVMITISLRCVSSLVSFDHQHCELFGIIDLSCSKLLLGNRPVEKDLSSARD